MDMKTFPFRGKVSISSPDQIFNLLEDYGRQKTQSPEEPECIYFGRWVSASCTTYIISYI